MDPSLIAANVDVWRAIAWWLQFPQLSTLWATGNKWIQHTIGAALGLKIVGYCDPLVFEFTKLAVLDLSDDVKFDLTAISQPLPVSITSLSLWLRPTPQRPLTISDFPSELRELTIYTEDPIEFSALPRTLTSLTIESGSENISADFWPSFLISLVSWLPELQTLVMPSLPVLFELPITLPPGLTRLQAACCTTKDPRNILQIPMGITALDLHWKPKHIPHLPHYLTRLTIAIDYHSEPLTAEQIGMLPHSITQLNIGYTGEDVSCFERLPLRNLTLHLKSSIDFQGNFPQLSKLEVTGLAGANMVYVPATVQVLRLYVYKGVVFPHELRLRKLLGRSTGIGEHHLSECTSYINHAAAFTSITAITTGLYSLNPVHLTQLVMSVSSNISIVHVIGHLLRFGNLTELVLSEVRVEGNYPASSQPHVLKVMLPSTLTRFHLDGRYILPNLELPPSLISLYLRNVAVHPQVLLPLQNLRLLTIYFVAGGSWPLSEMIAALDELPLRMTNVDIYQYKFRTEMVDFFKCYMAKRERYLVDYTISGPDVLF